MDKYIVFVSTCNSVESLYKSREKSNALDLPQKHSSSLEIEADNLDDAFKQFCKTDKYFDYVVNNPGDIHLFYLVNGIPYLYK